MTEEVLDTAPAEQAPVDDAPAPEPEAKPEQPEAPQKAPSAREALEKAFGNGTETVPTAEEKAAAEAKAAEAKAPKAEARPEAKPEAKQDGPQRAPDGKFAPKDGEKAPEKPQEAAEAPKDDKGKAPHNAPPSRFSADAKAEWEKAPEPIRAETHRAIREMEQGIQRYKERMEPLEPLFQEAEQAGKKLHEVFGEYRQMERILSQNPAQGLATIAQRMGFSPQQAGQMLLGGQQDPRDQQIMQMAQELQQLKQGYGQINQTFEDQRRSTVMTQIEQFAAANEHFEALEGDIAQLLHSGEADTLEDAYGKALSRAQEIAQRFAPQQAAPPPTPAPPAQTREPRSLTGAPSPGSNPTTQRTPPKSARESLKRHLIG